MPAGSALAATSNTSWSGAVAEPAGAVISTCWPTNENPLGASATTGVSAIVTVPPPVPGGT